jgi:hypothetical protein
MVPGVIDCHMVELMHLSPAHEVSGSTEILVEVQALLTQFQSVFATTTKLPPRRACDRIIPGATPVFARPYRYAHAMEDEIEKQVPEMLKAGIIQ